MHSPYQNKKVVFTTATYFAGTIYKVAETIITSVIQEYCYISYVDGCFNHDSL